MSNISFAKTINRMSLGTTAASIMTDCEHYGMTYGCNVECPVLCDGRCELQETDNKELYEEAIKEA
jgi:hypothetical protein